MTEHTCIHDANALLELQSLPLNMKVMESRSRIAEWAENYGSSNIYVAFSGGKDSLVLLDIVRRDYPDTPAVFVNTGLEFPEIVKFVRKIDNVIWLKPKMNFKDVIKKYGYPVVSKEQAQFINEARNTKSEKLRDTRINGNKYGRGKVSNKWKFLLDAPFKISDKCCHIMKKEPSIRYEKESGKKPFIGTMVSESQLRRQKYLKTGCNAFNVKRPNSTPISFWKEDDIWNYIRLRNIEYSNIYDMGYKRTGCAFCAFGAHHEKDQNRFQVMAKTHPTLHKFCMTKLGLREVLEFCNIKTGIVEETKCTVQCEFPFMNKDQS